MERILIPGQIAKYYLMENEIEMTYGNELLYDYIQNHKFKLPDGRFVIRIKGIDNPLGFQKLMIGCGVNLVKC